MYCRNCGKPVTETDEFCPVCGTNREGSVPKEILIRQEIRKDWSYPICVIFSSLMFLFMLLPDYSYIDVFNREIGVYHLPVLLYLSFRIGISWFQLVVLGIAGLWIACIIRLFIYTYTLIMKPEESIQYGRKAMMLLTVYVSIVLGFSFLFIGIEEARPNGVGFVANFIVLLLLIFVILMRVKFYRRLANIICLAQNNILTYGLFRPHTISKSELKICSNCNHEYEKSMSTCPQCGHRQNALWVCSQCNTHNEKSQLLCKNCGHAK
jgi:RNA polymerase subunit RPABC4/transcription elongation factor Spt4